MSIEKQTSGKSSVSISSESLAVLIVDGLLDAGLVKDDSFDEAVKIVTLEINIRKHAGDY